MSGEWNIDQVVENIEALYSTNNPEQVKIIQNNLQALQKSDDGYKFAKSLFNYQSKNCKFFGALTFTVIINQNKTFEIDKLDVLTSDLINLIIGLVNEDFNGNLFIIKKLLSDLSLLFINNFKSLVNPIRLLFLKISNNNQLLEYISSLNESQFSILLLFHTIIVEDIVKNEVSRELHQVVKDNLFSDLNIIFNYLNPINTNLPNSISVLGLDCLNAWFIYLSNAEVNSNVRYLNETDSILEFLFNNFNNFNFYDVNAASMELINKSVTVIIEILEINPRLLSNNYKDLLSTILFKSFGLNYIDLVIYQQDFKDEFAEEIENFINLLIIFLTVDILKFTKKILDFEIQQVLEILIKLTNYPGIPVIDESISEQFLTFWEELANIYIDNSEIYKDIFNSKYDEFLIKRNDIFHKVSLIYWKKIQLPELRLFESNKMDFLHYRSQVSDFFIVMYSLLNLSIYENLTTNVINNLREIPNNQLKLIELESSLYLLFKITDDLTFYDDNSSSTLVPFINELFENNLIEMIQRLPINNIYRSIYSTLINFLSSIQFFFSRNTKFIGSTFDLLFSIILNNNVNNDNSNIRGNNDINVNNSLSLVSSKTILKICQESRNNLIDFLPNLQILLNEMLRDIKIDNLIRQRLCNCYISIAQCIKDPVKLGEIILALLTEIYSKSLEIMKLEFIEEYEDYLNSLLSCVHEIGKACQLPEEPEDFFNSDQRIIVDKYWHEDPLNIKQLILTIIKEFSLNYEPLIQNTTITEKSCLILKSGINEPINGPFQFSFDVIFNYIITKINRCNLNSIPYIYGLIETIVIVNYKDLNVEIINELVNKVFIEKLEILKIDPDLIQSSIELFSTILEKKPSLIINLSIFQDIIIEFAVKSLESNETFILKSSSKFWTNLINLKRGNLQDHNLVKDMMINKNLGYSLTINLLKCFISSSRLHLEYYYPIFRNLIAKYSINFKAWLKSSFVELNLKNLVEEKDIDFLINKIMITRGQRSVNDILKKFWLQCNGFIEFNSKNY